MVKDLVPGGRSDKKPDSAFDSKQIQKGIKVEQEHTKNKQLAKEIAKDHLSEFPDYYDRLEKMEKSAYSKIILAKIEELTNKISKFNFYSPWQAQEKYKTLKSIIDKNEGVWKNKNIIKFLTSGDDSDIDESSSADIHKAVLRYKTPSDLGAVFTSITINPDKFKGKYRTKDDIFIYDLEGIRLHFKVKNNYKDEKVPAVTRSGETYLKNETTKIFNSLELQWERSQETQEKIDKSKEKDSGWYNKNKDKIDLILEKVKENKYNENTLNDLKLKIKVDDKKLESLYDEAVAQSGQDFVGEKKHKTEVKIQSISVKESVGFRGRTEYKTQIIGISPDFKQKILIKFGRGTRAGEQLAKIFNLPKKVEDIEWVWIGGHDVHFTRDILEVSEKTVKLDLNMREAKNENLEMLNSIKSGDVIEIAVAHGMSAASPYKVKVKRNGDILTFDNPIEHDEGDLHEYIDDLKGNKVTVEGDFKRWQDLIFVSKPKFTKA